MQKERNSSVAVSKETLKRLKQTQASLTLAIGESFSLDEVLNVVLDSYHNVKE